jgi:Tfp pilus assembly protein PilO
VKGRVSKQKLLLYGIPVLGILIGLLGYVAVVAPQQSKGRSMDSELQALQAQLLVPKVKPPKPVPVQAADIFRLTKAMPDANDLPGILLQLSRLARASSIKINSVRPSARVPLTQGYAALPVAVTVSGGFGAVSKFLQLLRQQVTVSNGQLNVDGRLLVANQVQITSTDGRSVSATLNLDAFVYGVAPPAPPPAPTSTDGTATTAATTTTASGH